MDLLTKRRPYLFSGYPGRPDLYGCQLWLPLYRGDMVARGGSIENGTGLLDVSPQNLAVGANTLTTTQAGTFLISVPNAATCASGTATITGSPVTLNPGLNTVTQTGAVGTFTVTTTNTIYSKDASPKACTVTGPTWGSQGYTNDAIDDDISAGDVSALNFGTSDFTLEVTYKYSGSGQNYRKIFSKGIRLGATNEAGYAYEMGGSGWWVAQSSTIYTLLIPADISYNTSNTWFHAILDRQGANLSVMINGVLSNTAQVTAGGGITGSTNVSNARNFKIQNSDAKAVYGWEDCAGGVCAELIAYNTSFSTATKNQHYLSAKRRMGGLL